MPVALLFDLDGTLVLGGGAGRRAMQRAVREWTQTENDLSGVDMAGRTDPDIFRDLLRASGRPDEPVREDLIALYLQCLREEVARTPGRMAPGVQALLECLAADPHVRLALATGNLEAGARIKLEPHGLNGYFPLGGYGSDSSRREELVATAYRRILQREGLERRTRGIQAIVVGDTPRDVAAARANHMACIAVATGPFDRESLLAAGADVVFADLTEPELFLNAVRRLASPAAG